jgi:hypothetical protein
MRRALYASGGIHLAVLGWALLGGQLFWDTDEPEFEVTGVTLLSTSEFDAMFSSVPSPALTETPTAPVALPETDAPIAPTAEAVAPEAVMPEAALPPPAETEPDVSAMAPPPQTDVTDQIALLPSPPAQDETAPLSDTPAPSEAPRVAPTPAPAPPPEAEIAPQIAPQPTPADTPTPLPDTPPTAPEEAAPEIVTEAETPASSLAPVASTRPAARPERVVQAAVPAPEVQAPAADESDPLAAAIAAAVAEAASAPAAPATPSGPPLTSGQREGLRVAVQNCWNVGALSSEALRVTVTIEVRMGRDGVPEQNSIRMLSNTGGSDTAIRQAYEAARRAVLRCGTSGYDLPDESYDQWRTIEITFNPEDMRLR